MPGVGATVPGAAWQRCRTYPLRANLMAATPKAPWPWVRALPHSVYDQPDAAAVHAQFDQILDVLTRCRLRSVDGIDSANPEEVTIPALRA